MHCKACRKHPYFMAEMVGRQAAEMRDTTGRRKQMGRICKRLLSLWKRAKKKKCYNSKAHPWSLKQRKTIMVNNTRVIIKRIAHSLYPLSIQLTFTVPYFQTADEAPPTFSHPLKSHPYWAIGSEHLFHCGAKRGLVIQMSRWETCVPLCSHFHQETQWQEPVLLSCDKLLRFANVCECVVFYKHVRKWVKCVVVVYFWTQKYWWKASNENVI